MTTSWLPISRGVTDAARAGPSFTSIGPVAVLVIWGVLLGASAIQDALALDREARVWLLDVDNERSFYTWFSQLLLALAGLLLVDTGVKSSQGDRTQGLQFLTLGAVFFLLSADEGLSFHEKLGASASGLGGLHFGWVIPAAALCLVGLLIAVPFLRRLSRRVRFMMLAAGGVFLFGALVVEAVSGQALLAAGSDILARPYRLLVNIEEGAEGLGVILFLFALMRHRDEAGILPGISLFR